MFIHDSNQPMNDSVRYLLVLLWLRWRRFVVSDIFVCFVSLGLLDCWGFCAFFGVISLFFRILTVSYSQYNTQPNPNTNQQHPFSKYQTNKNQSINQQTPINLHIIQITSTSKIDKHIGSNPPNFRNFLFGLF